MDFNSISIIHSNSQSSIQNEVSIINYRMIEAESRLKALATRSKSSVKLNPHQSILIDHGDTKRSNLTYKTVQPQYQRETLPIKSDIKSNKQFSKQCLTNHKRQLFVQDNKTRLQQRILYLQQQLQSKQIEIQKFKQLQYEKNRNTHKRYSRNEQRLTNELDELKQILKQEIERYSKLEQENITNKRRIKQLLEKNHEYQCELQSLHLAIQSIKKYKETQTNNISYINTNQQKQSYKLNLATHYKQCLILCQFVAYISEVLSRLKTSQIPATAVMIRQQLISNIPLVEKITDRVKQLCPELLKEKQLFSKRKENLTSKRFVGGDQKQNVDTNRTGLVILNNTKNNKSNTLAQSQQFMQLLLIQAQTLEQCI